MSSLAYTRWDPKARAGAIAVRATSKTDVQAAETISDHVREWAKYQNLVGEHDVVETSPIRGSYDWRSYIQEETQMAKRREEASKPRDKKVERAAPAPAPSVFYA